jgi:hypothetical protein
MPSRNSRPVASPRSILGLDRRQLGGLAALAASNVTMLHGRIKPRARASRLRGATGFAPAAGPAIGPRSGLASRPRTRELDFGHARMVPAP